MATVTLDMKSFEDFRNFKEFRGRNFDFVRLVTNNKVMTGFRCKENDEFYLVGEWNVESDESKSADLGA